MRAYSIKVFYLVQRSGDYRDIEIRHENKYIIRHHVIKLFNLSCFLFKQNHLDISLRNITLSLGVTDNIIYKFNLSLRRLPCDN